MDESTYIRRLYEEISFSRVTADTIRLNNYAALYGSQWGEWNHLSRHYINYLIVASKVKPVAITINKIRPIMRARSTFIIGENPKISVSALSDETEDKEAAYIAHRVARADWEENNLYARILEAWEWTKSCGMSFIRTYYDPSAGRYLGKYNNKPVFEGQVKAKVLPCFSVLWDPLADTWEDIRFCIVANVYPIETLEAMVPDLDFKELENDKWAAPPPICEELMMQITSTDYGLRESMKDMDKRKRAFLVLEYFEKPSYKYPQGRYIMVLGHRVIKKEPLQFGIIPLVLFADSTVAGTINCETPVTEMRPIQEALNRFVSLDIERSRMPDIYSFPRGANYPKNLSDRAFIVTEYNPGMGTPNYIQGGMARSDYLEKIQRFEEWMEHIAGVSSIASRARPPYQMSGRMGYIVNEANRALLSDISKRLKRSIKELIRMRLLFMRHYYTEERIMSYINEYDKREVVRFTGSQIGENWTVDVELSEVTSDPEARAFKLLQLNQNPLVMQELIKDPVAYRKFLIAIDPEIGYDFFRSENDINVARDEHQDFAKGKIPQVQPWHNDKAHMQEHKRMLDSDVIKKWPVEYVNNLIVHYYLHEQQELIKAKKEAMKQFWFIQSAQALQAEQGKSNIPKPKGMDMLESGPQTPLQAIDSNLELQTRMAYPGAEAIPTQNTGQEEL